MAIMKHLGNKNSKPTEIWHRLNLQFGNDTQSKSQVRKCTNYFSTEEKNDKILTNNFWDLWGILCINFLHR